MLSIFIPADSPNVIESKSLKLYLYSFANSCFQNILDIISTIEQDLSNVAGCKIKVALANISVDFMHIEPRFPGQSLDNLDVNCTDQEINPKLLTCDPKQTVTEQLSSDLFKANCIITNKPFWGSIRASYTGSKIDQEGLLKYIISYRNRQATHELCVEQIYFDLLNICKPSKLVVEGRFTRRGSLDINVIRANTEFEQVNRRLFRQ